MGNIKNNKEKKTTQKSMELENGWTCTDPDRKQYGRQVMFTTFEFKEQDVHLTIDLSDYTVKYVEDLVKGYYKDIESVFEIYKHEANFIIAECIFESESGLY